MRSMIGILYSRFKLFPFADAADSFRMMNIDNSVLWFLTSMFTAYCLFRLLLDIRCDRNRILGAIACVAVGYVYPYIPLLLPWSLDTAFFIAPLMLGGNMVRRYGILEHYGWKLLLLSVPAYMACNYFAGATNYSIREMGVLYPASFGCGLFGAVALFVLFRLPFCSYIRSSAGIPGDRSQVRDAFRFASVANRIASDNYCRSGRISVGSHRGETDRSLPETWLNGFRPAAKTPN